MGINPPDRDFVFIKKCLIVALFTRYEDYENSDELTSDLTEAGARSNL